MSHVQWLRGFLPPHGSLPQPPRSLTGGVARRLRASSTSPLVQKSLQPPPEHQSVGVRRVKLSSTCDLAKGILMGQRGCDAEEAFHILVKLSQDTNRKLRDVAHALSNRPGPPENGGVTPAPADLR